MLSSKSTPKRPTFDPIFISLKKNENNEKWSSYYCTSKSRALAHYLYNDTKSRQNIYYENANVHSEKICSHLSIVIQTPLLWLQLLQ